VLCLVAGVVAALGYGNPVSPWSVRFTIYADVLKFWGIVASAIVNVLVTALTGPSLSSPQAKTRSEVTAIYSGTDLANQSRVAETYEGPGQFYKDDLDCRSDSVRELALFLFC